MSKHTAIRRSTLVSSIAMLLIAVVALSGATYAWFSSNNSATAGELNLTATSASGLFIVEDTDMNNTTAPTTGYSSKIEWSDNVEGMRAVSGKPNGSANSAFYATTTDRADGQYNGDTVNNPITVAQAGSDYIIKKVWVKADSTETQNLKITPTVTSGRGYERVAIAAAGQDATIFGNTAETYAQFGQTGVVENATITTVEYATGASFSNTYDQARCFYIFVWFEGQDPQCTNVNSGSSFTVSLNFTLA